MIKKSVKSMLSKSPILSYWQKCISGMKNPDYMKTISGEGGMIFRICERESNDDELEKAIYDKIAYNIFINNAGDGFFALFRASLNYLYFSSILNLEPYITWGPDVAYYEENKAGFEDNVFLYYFSQVSSNCIDSYKYVIDSMWAHQKVAENLKTASNNGYYTNDEYIFTLGRIIKKYISLNKFTQDKISLDLKKIEFNKSDNSDKGKRWLGIHIRGTDYKQNCIEHPTMPSISEYFEVIDELLEKNQFEEIFLATDDSEFQADFISRYGEKIHFYSDVMRSSGDESVAFSTSKRENHKYLLGYEVLRDAITLSLCDGLICGLSQVSIAVRMFKASKEEEFNYLHIIDKGINDKGKKFERP